MVTKPLHGKRVPTKRLGWAMKRCHMRAMPPFLTFASEAEIVALWGAASLCVALVALFMERRRMKRTSIDRVGWMPWTGLFLTFAVLGGALLLVSLPGVIRG